MDQDLLTMIFGEPNLTPAERERQQRLAQAVMLRAPSAPQPAQPMPAQPQIDLTGQFGQQMPQPGWMPSLRPQAAARALPRAPGGATLAQPPGTAPAAPQASSGAPINDLLGQQYTDLQRQQAEAEAARGAAYQPVDRSAMERAYQAQQQAGGQHLLMALAAQEAGKDFAPFQAHYLKKATEAQAPMKMAGGTMTESGFVEDPVYAQNLAIQRADAKLKQIDSLLQSNLTMQERARLQDEKLRADAELKLALKQMGVAAAGAGKEAINQDRIYRGEDRMKNDFEQITKPAREGYDASRQAQVVLNGAAGRRLTNVEQQSLITLFNKFLDPGSVVREGEFNRMAQGMGLAQRIQNWSSKIMEGSIITPQMAQEIGRVAALYEKDALSRIQQQSSEYGDIAARRGYSPESIITNPSWRPVQTQAVPAGAVRERGAPPPQAAPVEAGGPPPGAVRERRK